jgi:HK97 family phage portal protein
MRWAFSKSSKFNSEYEKLNPGQADIVKTEGDSHHSRSSVITNQLAYERVECVTRGVNLIVDSCAEIQFDTLDKLKFTPKVSLRKKQIDTLLNFRPNPFVSADEFKRNLYIDLILEGNAFIYFDGAYLYNIPAMHMNIVASKTTFISHYEYEDTKYSVDEIIHIRENSSKSIYRGTSRLQSASTSIKTMHSLSSYQENFFDNFCIPGLVLKTKNILSPKIKNRIIADWKEKFKPKHGGRSPVILDGDMDLDTVMKGGTVDKIDFTETVASLEAKILTALGVPVTLVYGGNNANISPNLKLFYITTIMPLVLKVTSSLESFFGYDMKPVSENILALRPELRELASYLTLLVNAGLITRNEGRAELRYEPRTEEEFANQLILPVNVAGSAANPSEGGRPPKDPEAEEEGE